MIKCCSVLTPPPRERAGPCQAAPVTEGLGNDGQTGTGGRALANRRLSLALLTGSWTAVACPPLIPVF